MKCLSVKQPHASRIADGLKRFEIRTWQTRYRGPLLICSGKKTARGHSANGLPKGVAVCLVNLVDVQPFTPDMTHSACVDWRANAYAWVLSEPKAVTASPVSGQLGLFDVPEGLGF